MTEREKDVISTTYDRYEDMVVMWIGQKDDNAVYFSDVRALVRQSGVSGNVSVTYVGIFFFFTSNNFVIVVGFDVLCCLFCGQWLMVRY